MSSVPKPPPATPSPKESAADDSFVLTLPDDPASNKDWYLWAGVLALLVFVAFIPAVTGQYLWDDDRHAGLIQFFSTLNGLKKLWIPQAATPQYYPLTFTTFWIEHLLWADSTLGYHIDNMILHAASAVLVWRLLRRLKLPGAWLAAAIWAIHPLQTESVAWISERKNVLSGLLFFASIWFYLEYEEWPAAGKKSVLGDKRAAYGLSLFCFVLALLAKTVACAMPAVMLILAWWRGRKLSDKKTWLPLAPFFGLGLALGLTTAYLEVGNVGALGSDWNLSPIQRLLIASRGVWFYVCKLILPVRLTFSYPRVLPDAAHWLYLAGAIGVTALFWFKRTEWGRGPLAAVLYYVVTLFPSLGFINIYPMRYSFVADHFQYLAGLGLIVLAVAAGAKLIEKLRIPTGAAASLGVAVVLAFFCPAWLQAHAYESTELLWRDVLAKNPNSWMADDNLGVALINLGEQEEAEAANDRMQGQPDAAADADADAKSRLDEAEQRLKDAVKLRDELGLPPLYTTHNALGLLYRYLDRWTDAENELKIAVEIDDANEVKHRGVSPYVNYAQAYEHNHPDADVRPWLDKAMAVIASVPNTKQTEVAETHRAYGGYWSHQAAAANKAQKLDDERSNINNEIEQLKLVIDVVPTDIQSLLALAQAYQQLGYRDAEKAIAERVQGHSDQAAHDEYLSREVDDTQALQYYWDVVGHVPNGRNAPALLGIGTIYWRGEKFHDNQADTINDLLFAMKSIKDSLDIDPSTPDAARYLTLISQDFTTQAQLARDHEATWQTLRQRLQALADGNVSKTTAEDADKAVLATLYPAPAGHPMRGPLMNVRAAIGGYLSATPPPEAARTVTDTAKTALEKLNARNQAEDMLNDVKAAANCYQGVVIADERSAIGWRNLKEMADTLAGYVASHPDRADAKESLRVALSVLDQHRAATQPVPSKVEGPVTQPATAPATLPAIPK